jgi:twitching motility protein PilT
LRAALRQAPKVILVGELRDRETMEMILEAAETGHLVLSSLNAPSVVKTLERIVTAFPTAEQLSLRGRLAKTLRYVISQQLIPRKDGGRVAILEVFKNTTRTRPYLECEDDSGENLLEAVKKGSLEGMQHFDQEIERLVREGVVDLDTAVSYASDPQQLQNALSR